MNPIQKRSFHQLYSRPILFVGLLLLLAGTWCYMQMQTNLFPEVLFPRITVIADAGQQPVDRMMITKTGSYRRAPWPNISAAIWPT